MDYFYGHMKARKDEEDIESFIESLTNLSYAFFNKQRKSEESIVAVGKIYADGFDCDALIKNQEKLGLPYDIQDIFEDVFEAMQFYYKNESLDVYSDMDLFNSRFAKKYDLIREKNHYMGSGKYYLLNLESFSSSGSYYGPALLSIIPQGDGLSLKLSSNINDKAYQLFLKELKDLARKTPKTRSAPKASYNTNIGSINIGQVNIYGSARPASPVREGEVICGNCGTRLSGNPRFCPVCGYELRRDNNV